ncbi:MAG TPA: hypothetical protein DIC59_09600 [Candidatus Competibacteraceae bacterium]|mgnify:CR=1 FL=1|nr:hypothetical protein [Candidatus Competibacteraceae bacterium]
MPVVRDGRLIGLVTSHDLERVVPSPVSTLSAGEANYLLGYIATVVSPAHPDQIGPRIAVVRYRATLSP